ncbi:methylthioribose kinase [Alkalihalophilus pseudofirmus]|uniref:Methylthioribose kinase n=1 Tax=Alkalihalophilus pseudofirmus TaxID=79885 RepID=A0AAJ2NN28_ALKPS|nr:methylthioribose kinase [Alkalihalophilus pseudofirmus]MDV2885396.1 methylthioribose kinase [Alkalihalophilus pseudofirmus]
MIQRFIELGEGYSDIYELLELARLNRERIHRLIRLDTTIGNNEKTSLAMVLEPAAPGKLMPIYICREGVTNPDVTPNQRYDLFSEMAEELDLTIHSLSVKDSKQFKEDELYYQYLIGILRMNRYIPPLQ